MLIFFFRANNIEYDEYIIGYIADLSELGYMMLKIITEPIDLNIDTIVYNYDLSISGYTETGVSIHIVIKKLQNLMILLV